MLTFWTDGIQYTIMVAMEVWQEIVRGLSNAIITNALE